MSLSPAAPEASSGHAETLPEVLRAAASRYGDRPAIVDGDVTLTFAELLDLVRDTAEHYAVRCGVGPGARVAVWAPNTWRWPVAALAVSYVGGVLVPLNTRFTGHEVADVLARTDARLLVLDSGFLGRSQRAEVDAAAAEAGVTLPPVVELGGPDDAGLVREWPGLEWLVHVDVEGLADRVSPDDVADILFTSGTTGRSKGALSSHRQTVGVARIWGELGEVTADDRYLLVNPFFHSFGYKAGMVVCLLTGATMVPMAVVEPTAMMRLVETERITVLPGAPTIYTMLLEAPDRAGHDLSSLRFAVTGAAVVPVALVERMQRELGFDLVLTAFGMTECVVATMCRRGDPAALVAGTCGRAVPALEVRIAAPGTSDELPVGEEGELLLRGDHVMLGYLDDPDATAEAIDPDGWLHTGDVGRVDDAGYLRITDRLKDVVITGGFNVYPAEVEQALARLDGVVESAVVGVPDARLGEVGRAYVVRREGSALSEADVTAYARERLANFKVPREVVFVDALPRNPSGKILKRVLREGRPHEEES
ncbi:AMP-binding protein [Nocardioides sp. HDW12B]|uniref:FadD3 family acyl-CoA ligase n=1 Tax=Nocardioides sp. HDW12B TaxID=2714939 RepID=UPI001409FCD9|nr:FadD3 family acyl-CoA ligase [Nocardioides sp. HDW12B]QIK66247.1 AMP-binding protein [Nocardioides sp. HDW12B]